MKTLNIIAIVLFGLGVLAAIGLTDTAPANAVGWIFITSTFGLALAITSLHHIKNN